MPKTTDELRANHPVHPIVFFTNYQFFFPPLVQDVFQLEKSLCLAPATNMTLRLKKITVFSFCLTMLGIVHFSGFSQNEKPKKVTISGYIKEAGSNEPLVGATVYIARFKTGTVSNGFGYYSLTFPADTVTLWFTYVGYEMQKIRLDNPQSQVLNISLAEGKTLNEITVIGNQDTMPFTAENVQMSQLSIRPSEVKAIPALLGEKDVIKVLQLMPGVQKGSEGSAGLYVRGGGPDQNLILLDDAPVYNAFHLFGFFSLFNGDALKTIELTKGGFPARFGGRLSSVLEMRMKEGNQQKIKGEGGVGLLSTRFTIEGPIWKNKTSFLLSGRRSYLDVLAAPFQNADSKAKFYFMDFNMKVNHTFSDKDKLYLSGYFGRDMFGFVERSPAFNEKEEAGLYWGNATATLRWNHVFNPRLFSNISLIYSRYRFNIYNTSTRSGSEFNLKYYSGIEDFGAKADLDYYLSTVHQIKFGGQAVWHTFTPSAVVIKNASQNENRNEVKQYGSLESALYVEDLIRVTDRLAFNPGIRQAYFYADGVSRLRLEPRLSARYKIRPNLAIKASGADMNQFIHLLTNTGLGLPTDLWIPSSPRISPQRSQQVALGFAKDLPKQNLTLSLEGYYKQMKQVISYKEGASFLEIESSNTVQKSYAWEDQIVRGKSWSYGVEAMVQKHIGKLTGWIGYTLSWTKMNFPDLNNGKTFFARYDRRHDASVVVMYKLSEGISLSATWIYGTGNAITLPVSSYSLPRHSPLPTTANSFLDRFTNSTEYGDRNAYRMAAYHRMDVGIQWHKKKRWGERTWELSAYNMYNQQNPFFYYIGTTNNSQGQNVNTLKQITLFPFIPSLSYNFKF